MLDTTFMVAGPHIDAHRALHKAYNGAIYADDYDTLQDAVGAAETAGITRVVLNPTARYALSETLTLPSEVVLDGGGRSLTSTAAWATRLRAEIYTDAALDPMIRMGHGSGVDGCYINGTRRAATGIQAINVNYIMICDNLIASVACGVKCGGVLYPTMRRNALAAITGVGLDAQAIYGSSYYGINIGLSEQNHWSGAGGALLVEGILTSVADAFEAVCTGQPIVQLGGAVASQMTMLSPYFELREGTGSVLAIAVGTSSSITVHGARAYGAEDDAGSMFMSCHSARNVVVCGCEIHDFATVFAGTLTIASNLMIAGNYYRRYLTLNGFDTALANVESCLCVWPGGHIGAA